MKIQRLFSTKLPKDWDSDDDDYINMVENAKERNKKLAVASKYFPLIGNVLAGGGGALVGHAIGGTKGAAIGALAGIGSSVLGAGLVDSIYGTKIRKLNMEELSKRDQSAANKAMNKYKKMKTKEERLAYRKRVGSRV